VLILDYEGNLFHMDITYSLSNPRSPMMTGAQIAMQPNRSVEHNSFMGNPISDEWGEIIDLGAIAKSRRGAVASYEQGLLDALTKAFKAGQALSVTPFTVLESDYKSEEEFKNAKQSYAAEIRKHFRHLVVTEVVAEGSKVAINWHPETGVPQVSLRSS